MSVLPSIRFDLRCLACLATSVSLAILALATLPARAHGPCGAVGSSCLEPYEGPPGTVVTTVDFEGVLALWNPRPNVLALGVPGSSKVCDIECAAAKPVYHLDLPMVVLDQAPDRSRLQFVVPDVPPGKFVVVMYDGSEGGFHYTWDTFKVAAQSPNTELTRGDEPGTWNIRWLVAIGLLLLGVGAGWVLGNRR